LSGVNLEKVVLEDAGDAFQFVGVYGTFGEDFVHIGTVAAQFRCKPYYSFSLQFQLLLYELSNVHFGWGARRFPSGICACKALINKKDVGISFAYSVIRALALPLERISNASQPTPE
jgi:hypothetical protein